jgi:hypothetical protein
MEVILILCVQKTNYLQIIKNSDLLILNLKSGKSIIHLYCFVYEIRNFGKLRDLAENIDVLKLFICF